MDICSPTFNYGKKELFPELYQIEEENSDMFGSVSLLRDGKRGYLEHEKENVCHN